MSTNNRKKVWDLMAENAAHIDRFISVSRYYAAVSAEKMNLSPDKISSIHIGVDPSDYEYRNSREKPRAIGYISRMCFENGLDILVDAFILLKKQKGYDDLKLILTGGQTGDDKPYLKQIRKKLDKFGLLTSVDFHKDFEGSGRKAFFDKASVISVPVRNGEAFGIYIAESLASGIPVVQPALGAFPEVLAATGGGIIYQENNPEALSSALKQLLDDPVRLMHLSEQARKGAEQHLDITQLAKKLVEIYNETISV
jgi:glycosyltransferase involved in cell wall biosynthesis